MTEGNYYLRDVSLNADIIEHEVLAGRVALSTRSLFAFPGGEQERRRTAIDEQLAEAMVRCENIRYMAEQMETTAHEAIENAALAYIETLLRSDQYRERPIICVFAPMFDDENIADGYYRRIRNIDSLFPDEAFRIHFYPNPQSHWASATLIDDDHLLVAYEHARQVSNIFKLVNERSKFVYCHSIYCFDPMLLEEQGKKVVLDFHGAVPEEAIVLLEDEAKSKELAAIERRAVAKASTIVAVTNSMVSHIQDKYPGESRKTSFIVMPIFDMDNPDIEPLCKAANEKPRVIYAGGTQTWQLFDEMIDAAESQPDCCSYSFFVPDPSVADSIWNDRKRPSRFSMETKTPWELRQEYAASDFGFALRDDSTVNRVACPTKLIEYLAYGVIPIMKFTGIGDFESDGIAYVALEDFKAGNLPSPTERETMRETNYRVIASQLERFSQGRDKLQAFFANLLEKGSAGM